VSGAAVADGGRENGVVADFDAPDERHDGHVASGQLRRRLQTNSRSRINDRL
jgi:hypothetical protein